MDAGIGVHPDALGGGALGAVAGDGVAMIEMTVLRSVEIDLAVLVEAYENAAVWRDGFNGGKVTIGDAERLVGRGELNAVAN